jgi:hypothetical protein
VNDRHLSQLDHTGGWEWSTEIRLDQLITEGLQENVSPASALLDIALSFAFFDRIHQRNDQTNRE